MGFIMLKCALSVLLMSTTAAHTSWCLVPLRSPFSSQQPLIRSNGFTLSNRLLRVIQIRGGDTPFSILDDSDEDEDKNGVIDKNGEISDDDDDDDNAEDDEEDEDDESFALIPSLKNFKIDDTVMDPLLSSFRVIAKFVGSQYQLLSMIPQLHFLLTNVNILQMVLTLFITQFVAKRLDYSNPSTLFRLRMFYTLSMCLIQLSYLLIRYSILKLNDQTEVVSANPLLSSFPQNQKTGDEDTNETSKNPLSEMFGLSDMVKQVVQTPNTVTVRDYDLTRAKSASSSYFGSMCLTYLLHFFMHFHTAILQAPIGPLLNTFSDPLFQIHIMQREAVGTLSRPFTRPSFFDQLKSKSTSSSDEKEPEENGNDSDDDNDDYDAAAKDDDNNEKADATFEKAENNQVDTEEEADNEIDNEEMAFENQLMRDAEEDEVE